MQYKQQLWQAAFVLLHCDPSLHIVRHAQQRVWRGATQHAVY